MSTTTRHDDRHGATDLTLEQSVSRLVKDAREVRAATAELSGTAHEAEQRYVDEVSTTLATLEFDLRTAKAALDARRAESSTELHGSIEEVEQAARTWLDDLSLQAGLGRMEVRDRVQVVTQRLERAGAEARRAVGRVGDALVDDLDEMRHATLDNIGEVRSALSDAVTALRKLDG